MDEDKTIIQPQSSEPVKTSKWANLAILLLAVGYITPLFSILLIIIFDSSELSNFIFPVCLLFIFASFISIIASLVSGVIAAISIAFSKWRMEGFGRAVTSIILSLIYFVIAFNITMGISYIRMRNQRNLCAHQLYLIGMRLTSYADNSGKYPQSEKWCDILLQFEDANEAIFKCPVNKKVKCSYSINLNCDSNSEPNTVLVFESNGGWNSYGGPELLVTNRHKEGSNFLFNDGHVKFIETDTNGKLTEELNWGKK
jgi:prepilin-type processing-associated H-X9-DG protein